MTHFQLRAIAALWSLRAALALLDTRIAEEDHAIAAERVAAADPLKSPNFGRRHALGGHGDPTGDAILTIGDVATRTNRWASLDDEVRGQLAGVVAILPPASVGDLDRLAAAVPAMSPRAAEATRQLLDRIDGRIRRLLGAPVDRHLVPRAPCPDCDVVALVIRTSAPLAERVVECTACPGTWLRTQMVGA